MEGGRGVIGGVGCQGRGKPSRLFSFCTAAACIVPTDTGMRGRMWCATAPPEHVHVRCTNTNKPTGRRRSAALVGKGRVSFCGTEVPLSIPSGTGG